MRFRVLACTLWVFILGASQAFEDGAEWKDTQATRRAALVTGSSSKGTQTPKQIPEIAGIKPGRHLQTLDWFPVTASAYSTGCTMPRSGVEPGHSITASGAELIPNWHIAADPYYPFGTVLQLSYDGIVTNRIVADRGRGIKGKNRIDLAMADCDRAKAWGVRKVWARVLSRPLGGTK